jgi:hypothetical protein
VGGWGCEDVGVEWVDEGVVSRACLLKPLGRPGLDRIRFGIQKMLDPRGLLGLGVGLVAGCVVVCAS